MSNNIRFQIRVFFALIFSRTARIQKVFLSEVLKSQTECISKIWDRFFRVVTLKIPTLISSDDESSILSNEAIGLFINLQDDRSDS